MEHDAVNFGVFGLQELLEMKGDRFSLTVGVRCQKNFFGFLGQLFQVADDLLLVRQIDIRWLVIVFQVDSQNGRRQIAHMPHGGSDQIVLAQILGDGI